MQSTNEIKALLEWQFAMGVDETIAETATDQLSAPMPAPAAPKSPAPAAMAAPRAEPAPAAPALSTSLAETIAEAERLAKAANSLESLAEAVNTFDGCPLKKTARHTVFADGAAESDVMCIGEAPGADEDRQGIPFCGASGQLLDKMLASIGLNRAENCYITNTLFWRPPGNRTPTPEEIAICRPFVQRHIALFQPKLIIMVGGTAAKSLLAESRGVMKLRGQKLSYTHPNGAAIPTRVIFHPSYLLRQPLQKRLAWQDLLEMKAILDDR